MTGNTEPPPAEAEPQQAQTDPPRYPSPEQCQGILLRRLDELAVTQRIRITYQAPFVVVFVTGRRVNHLLHAIATIYTFGFWSIGWLITALRGGERWTAMTVDPNGEIRFTLVPGK